MATFQDIITRSLRLLGAIESGESPTQDELNDGLTSLKSMLGGWRLNRLLVYAYQHEEFTLIANQGTYTVGPAADFVTTRPLDILGAYVRNNGIDYPINKADAYKWLSITDKSTATDYPSFFYYEATYPLGTLKLNPVPSAAYSIFLLRQVDLLDDFALVDDFEFPPGYERAITYNLAIEVSPEYEAPLAPALTSIAGAALADISRKNSKAIATVPEFYGTSGRQYDIVGDV